MSASYQPILWNRQKKLYDCTLAIFMVFYISAFVAGMLLLNPQVTEETLIIRSTGTLAVLILHVILAIGPLARINPIFLPLLYNRRHLGVTMFFIGATHAIFSIIQFHALGNIDPILSLFLSNEHYGSLSKFPFEILGFVSLMIFFIMAITSHDFWLHNLSPRIWKLLHMMVYFAYAFILLHILLGVIQYETSPALFMLAGTGLIILIALHLIAGFREQINDVPVFARDGLIKVCQIHEIPENRARIVTAGGERIAVFKYNHHLSAVSNVCKHQLGPLGEGKIIDGCITCPWHGYQYLPHNGISPPPFKEKVATYDVHVIDLEVWVNPTPYPEGTERRPAKF